MLRDLVPILQFKKRENTHGGMLLLVKLQAFSRKSMSRFWSISWRHGGGFIKLFFTGAESSELLNFKECSHAVFPFPKYENEAKKKIFTRAVANFFFNQFSGDMLCSSLVSFGFVLLFFCLIVYFLKLKIYIW